MRYGWRETFIVLLSLGLGLGQAQAEYGRPAHRKGSATSPEDSFERRVDLGRVRKGNFEWDTQRLISDGLLALHREHLQILKEMADIKDRLEELQEQHTGEEP